MGIHEDLPWGFAIIVGEMKEAWWHGVLYVLHRLRPRKATTITTKRKELLLGFWKFIKKMKKEFGIYLFLFYHYLFLFFLLHGYHSQILVTFPKIVACIQCPNSNYSPYIWYRHLTIG